jgi:hypothetical protein
MSCALYNLKCAGLQLHRLATWGSLHNASCNTLMRTVRNTLNQKQQHRRLKKLNQMPA